MYNCRLSISSGEKLLRGTRPRGTAARSREKAVWFWGTAASFRGTAAHSCTFAHCIRNGEIGSHIDASATDGLLSIFFFFWLWPGCTRSGVSHHVSVRKRGKYYLQNIMLILLMNFFKYCTHMNVILEFLFHWTIINHCDKYQGFILCRLHIFNCRGSLRN